MAWYVFPYASESILFFQALHRLTLCIFAAVYFLYDLSPITVTIREERRSFLHFITRLCAVLGGTFALTGQHLFLLIFMGSISSVSIT